MSDNDQYTEPAASVAYPKPKLLISADFHATDGRTPEHVEIEWHDEGPVTAGFVTEVLAAIAGVAAGRFTPAVDRGLDYDLRQARAADTRRAGRGGVEAAGVEAAGVRFATPARGAR